MSSTSTAALQACCVCGKETSTRCSACAKVGIELFFCSPEHQKLVWKDAHAKVCGEKAHPFLQPDMSSEEADQVKQYGKLDVHSLVPGNMCRPYETRLKERLELAYSPEVEKKMTVAAALSAISEVPVDDFEQVVPALLQDSNTLSAQRRTNLLRNARSMMFSCVRELCLPWLVEGLSPFYPVAEIAGYIALYYPEVSGSKEVSQVLHLALIAHQLIKYKRGGAPSGFNPAFALHAFRVFVNALFRLLPFKSELEIKDLLAVVQIAVGMDLPADIRYSIDEATGRVNEVQVNQRIVQTFQVPIEALSAFF